MTEKRCFLYKHACVSLSNYNKVLNWVVHVAKCCNSNTQTILYTKNYIDRFLSLNTNLSSINEFKLSAICSLWIASKVSDNEPLCSDECVYGSGGMFLKKEIVEYEKVVLKVLGYQMYCTIPNIPLTGSPELKTICEQFLSYTAISYLFAFIDCFASKTA